MKRKVSLVDSRCCAEDFLDLENQKKTQPGRNKTFDPVVVEAISVTRPLSPRISGAHFRPIAIFSILLAYTAFSGNPIVPCEWEKFRFQ